MTDLSVSGGGEVDTGEIYKYAAMTDAELILKIDAFADLDRAAPSIIPSVIYDVMHDAISFMVACVRVAIVTNAPVLGPILIANARANATSTDKDDDDAEDAEDGDAMPALAPRDAVFGYFKTRSGGDVLLNVSAAACTAFGFAPNQRVNTPNGQGEVVGVGKMSLGERLYIRLDCDKGVSFWNKYQDGNSMRAGGIAAVETPSALSESEVGADTYDDMPGLEDESESESESEPESKADTEPEGPPVMSRFNAYEIRKPNRDDGDAKKTTKGEGRTTDADPMIGKVFSSENPRVGELTQGTVLRRDYTTITDKDTYVAKVVTYWMGKRGEAGVAVATCEGRLTPTGYDTETTFVFSSGDHMTEQLRGSEVSADCVVVKLVSGEQHATILDAFMRNARDQQRSVQRGLAVTRFPGDGPPFCDPPMLMNRLTSGIAPSLLPDTPSMKAAQVAQKQLLRARYSLASVRESNRELLAKVRRLEADNMDLRCITAQAEADLKASERMVKQQQQQNAPLAPKDSQAYIGKAKADANDGDSDIETMKRKDNQIAYWKARVFASERKLDVAVSEAYASTTRTAKVRAKLQDADDEVRAEHVHVEKLTRKVACLTSDLDSMMNTAAELEREVRIAEKDVDASNARTSEMSRMLGEARQDIRTERDLVERMGREVKTARDSAAIRAQAMLKDHVERLTQSFADLKTDA